MPINKIIWDDVVQFCNQRTAENSILDYKRNFPNHLENTISAMANTLGGIILVGVEEDNENKPKLPLKGMDWARGLEEKITSISVSQIRSPIIPEVQVVDKGKGKNRKAIVVIRVAQSHETYHAVARNTQVYIRTGNRNNPEELATLDRIEWLRNRREKSIAFRNVLIQRAQERFAYFYRQEWEGQKRNNPEASWGSCPMLTLSLCPHFPRDPFIVVQDTESLYRQVRQPDYRAGDVFGNVVYFPRGRGLVGTRFVPDGYVAVESDYDHAIKIVKCFYMEFNSFGLLFYRQTMIDSRRKDGMTDVAVLSAVDLMSRLDLYLESARMYYEKIGYRGPLQFRLVLEDVHTARYEPLHVDGLYDSPDRVIEYECITTVKDIEETRGEIIFPALLHISHAFDRPVEKKQVGDWYRYMRRSWANTELQ